MVALFLLAACGREATPSKPADPVLDLIAAGDRELATQSIPTARRAAELYEQALALTADPLVKAKIHAQLAEAYSICTPERVQAALEEVVRLSSEGGDLEGAFEGRITLASRYGELAGRVDALRALTAEAKAAGARRAELLGTAYLGSRLNGEARHDEAIKLLLGGLELARATPDAKIEGVMEYDLGLAYQLLGDTDRLLPHLLRSLELRRQAGLPLEGAQTSMMIGDAYLWLLQDPALALTYFTPALITFRTAGLDDSADGIASRIGVANAQLKLGDATGAVETLRLVLASARALNRQEVFNRRDAMTLRVLNALAPAYVEAGRLDEAAAAYAEAVELGIKLKNKHQETLALVGQARLALLQRRWKDAEALLVPVIAHIAAREADVTNERQRLTFAAGMRNVQGVLLEALAGQGDWARAFVASERMRSRRLLAGLGSDAIIDARGAQALLDADTTMIEYTFTGKRAYAFVIEARSLQGVDLGPAKEVQKAAHAWYTLASATSPAPGALDAATRALSDRILTPLVPRLRGRRLALVTDKALGYVAFAALPLPDGKPLLERFELVHVPSASVLAAMRQRRGTRPPVTRELAILADPIFDRTDARVSGAPPPAAIMLASRSADTSAPLDLVRLPSTHAEAEAIAALVPPERLFRAEGEEATREAALGPEVGGARLLHFATHAILDHVDPERSGLALTQLDARGTPVDGFVRAADIEKLSLAAELVVLSACRTAIGKSFDGEGLVGLTRAFLRAGVPRVVSSLWQVDDVATAELMERFYRGLLGERLSAPAALRQAQLEAAATGSASRSWAAFGFHGDWR